MVVSFVSFVLILIFFYLAFRLLGMLFNKALSLSSLGRIDQVGGGLVGFIRGWVLVGFVLFLLFYLPFPQRFYDSIENSFFAPALTGSVPMLYESTDFMHPQSPEFMPKIRASLDPRLAARGNGNRRIGFGRDDGRYGERVSRVLANLEARYGTNP